MEDEIVRKARIALGLHKYFSVKMRPDVIKQGNVGIYKVNDDDIIIDVEGMPVASGGLFLFEDELREKLDMFLNELIDRYRKALRFRMEVRGNSPDTIKQETILDIRNDVEEQELLFKMQYPSVEFKKSWRFIPVRSDFSVYKSTLFELDTGKHLLVDIEHRTFVKLALLSKDTYGINSIFSETSIGNIDILADASIFRGWV